MIGNTMKIHYIDSETRIGAVAAVLMVQPEGALRVRNTLTGHGQSHGFGPRDQASATNDGPFLFPLSYVYFINTSRGSQVFHTIVSDQAHRTAPSGPSPQQGDTLCPVPFVVRAMSLPLHRYIVFSFRRALFVYWSRWPSFPFITVKHSHLDRDVSNLLVPVLLWAHRSKRWRIAPCSFIGLDGHLFPSLKHSHLDSDVSTST